MPLTRERISLGQSGEEAALSYLKNKGFRIVRRNFRCHLGELDIIALDGPCLVFVEVRTVAGDTFGTALERVNRKKRLKIKQVAMYFINSAGAGDMPLRFDVMAVTAGPGGKITHMEHIINAF